MENEQQNWSKTLLNCYSHLETICDAIDQTVLNYGLKSFSSNQTMMVADQILSLIKRKKFLINTKVLVDNVLGNISGTSARLLTVRCIDKVKTEIASEVLNMSMRNFFRRLNLAIDEFSAELKHQGYDSQRLGNIFKKEGWIMEIYNSYCQKSKQKQDVDGLRILGIALGSLRQKKVQYGMCQ